MVVIAEPCTYKVKGSVASALLSLWAKPARPVTATMVTPVVCSVAWVQDSTSVLRYCFCMGGFFMGQARIYPLTCEMRTAKRPRCLLLCFVYPTC